MIVEARCNDFCGARTRVCATRHGHQNEVPHRENLRTVPPVTAPPLNLVNIARK